MPSIVFKLAGVRDRCRAHLLRHEHGCIAPWAIAGPTLGSQHKFKAIAVRPCMKRLI